MEITDKPGEEEAEPAFKVIIFHAKLYLNPCYMFIHEM